MLVFPAWLSREAAGAVAQGAGLPTSAHAGSGWGPQCWGSGVALLPAATRAGESGDRQFTAPEGKPSLALRSRAEEMTVGGFFRHAE